MNATEKMEFRTGLRGLFATKVCNGGWGLATRPAISYTAAGKRAGRAFVMNNCCAWLLCEMEERTYSRPGSAGVPGSAESCVNTPARDVQQLEA